MSLGDTVTDRVIDAFGEQVTVSIGGTPKTIVAVFEDGWEAVGAGEVDVSSSAPLLYCVATDVTGIAAGDTVTVRGTTWTVTDVQPDSQGMTTLRLRR